jgi:hypothetical protein
MKNVITRRRLHVLATVAALALGVAGSESAQAIPAARGCPTAEILATDNTAIITDPADSRLRTRLTRFDHEVRKIIHANGARLGSSTLLDGVFWSGDLRKATYERSREFDVNQVGRDGLHHIADVIAKQYHQESVLAGQRCRIPLITSPRRACAMPTNITTTTMSRQPRAAAPAPTATTKTQARARGRTGAASREACRGSQKNRRTLSVRPCLCSPSSDVTSPPDR